MRFVFSLLGEREVKTFKIAQKRCGSCALIEPSQVPHFTFSLKVSSSTACSFSGETSERSDKPNLSSDDRSNYSCAFVFSHEFMQKHTGCNFLILMPEVSVYIFRLHFPCIAQKLYKLWRNESIRYTVCILTPGKSL